MLDIHNQFTLSFINAIEERALGLDRTAARLVGVRPSDHVLAGFLTPVASLSRTRKSGEEEVSAEDLPQDSPYEQSALGLEWLIPSAHLQASTLSIQLSFSVFVRRLPSYREQTADFGWKRAKDPDADQESPLVPVWTREDLPPFDMPLDLSQLHLKGKVTDSLAERVNAVWQARSTSLSDLYPFPRPLGVPRSKLSPEEYPLWTAEQARRAAFAAPWCPSLDARITPVPTVPGCLRLSLRIINRSVLRDSKHLEFVDPNLYAVRLTVHIPYGAHHAMEFAELPHSYRYDRKITAVGINADVEEVQGEMEGILTLRTNSIPRKQVPRLDPKDIEEAAPIFDQLISNPIPLLLRILNEMRAYDTNTWQKKVASLDGLSRAEAERDREIFNKKEISAFERGIVLLENPAYPLVRRAFVLMNEAMRNSAGGRYDRWRLFQIVFIVSQLARLAGRHKQYKELGCDDDGDVDILWFAAGGGKTEAFMGLLVWQLFFDRLRGKGIGVTALIRFPLRLLTFQQLQRTARILAQAECIRTRERLGGARFALGYFVGSTTTPNSIDNDRHERYRGPHGPDTSMQSIKRCPFCGSVVELKYDEALRLVEHYCAQPGVCPGGTLRLPLYIIDDDIYRFLPSVIVSTIDKLALIGQNPRFGNLFGRFHLVCNLHGVSFVNSNRNCPAAQEFAKGARPTHCGEYTVSYGPFLDPAPSLHIQDELHLLSEETGTFDAHYETAALQIMKSLGAIPWKIIAATATIERFDIHARHLYLLKARQFPCPGPGAYDSFYYQVNPKTIGRIFVGVLGVSRKHTPAVTRLLSLLYQELQAARDMAAADLSQVCQRYHLPSISQDQFDELIFHYELVLTYVLTRKGSDQVAEAIQSRVKKELRETMPNHSELRMQTFNGGVDVTEMIDIMESIETEDCNSDPTSRVRSVVATNIISHGVDISRFNIMVFGGFTRLVAEYIQASARVGRTYPGLSFFVVTPQSDRDRSIFQRFGKFHEYLDRLVDPSAINRWPAQALERTVPGLLAGYLMIIAAAHLGRRLETLRQVQEALGEKGAECLNESCVLAWMMNALGVTPSTPYEQAVRAVVSNRYSQIITPAPEQRDSQSIREILNPMQSLRDIDDPAYITLSEEQDREILANLVRPWRNENQSKQNEKEVK